MKRLSDDSKAEVASHFIQYLDTEALVYDTC